MHFFQAVAMSVLLYRCTMWTLTDRMEKKIDSNYTRNAVSYTEQVLEEIPSKAAAVRPPTTHHENYPN